MNAVATKTIDSAAIYFKSDIATLLQVTPRCVEKRVARRQLPKPSRYSGRDPVWSGKELAKWFGVEAK